MDIIILLFELTELGAKPKPAKHEKWDYHVHLLANKTNFLKFCIRFKQVSQALSRIDDFLDNFLRGGGEGI